MTEASPRTADGGFLADIASQHEAIRSILSSPPALPATIRLADSQRVVLTGMGTSHFGTYGAWLRLTRAGIPAWWIPTDELLFSVPEVISDDTVVIVTSQSGRSAEAVELVARLGARRPPGLQVIAQSNTLDSPLATQADAVLDLCAGSEASVSTRTYVNTVVSARLLAAGLLREPTEAIMDEYAETAAGLEAFCSDVNATTGEIGRLVGTDRRLAILGREDATATALAGALILKEAAKYSADAMSGPQFRHGPIELADESLHVVVLESFADDVDSRLARDLAAAGAGVSWVGPTPPESIVALPTPRFSGAGRPVAQIVPLQLLSVALARAHGHAPGEFRTASKVTTVL